MFEPDSPQPQDILAIVREIIALLRTSPLTLSEVKQKVALLPLRAAAEGSARKDEPSFVRLEIPASAGLTLPALEDAFGTARLLPGMHRGAPSEYLIDIIDPAYPNTCSLIIEVPARQTGVEAVSVRRDKRL